ncbi:MAG: hypothetical protein IKF29_00435 [Oceanobacillus sp.]|nr:hypothetical protein [Oceanobacillus sp.]
MSNAKKCDRCGKLYEFYKGVKLNPKGNSYVCVDFIYGGNCGGLGGGKRFDLCKECMTDLVKWMNDGKEGADNEETDK